MSLDQMLNDFMEYVHRSTIAAESTAVSLQKLVKLAESEAEPAPKETPAQDDEE